ncbi:hypothetical protein [Phytohalomonas tamaricis]|uniref:hypothetical protein n=1 Tax=Phytohalomonas tamaricis TaxID=2081032 RepID=UPI000D0B6ABD|nr:hypothetical protein [Phytohalomonas tamaricis]
MLIIGLVLAIGGAQLLAAGGSAYYLLAGIGYILTGALMSAGLRMALGINAIIYIATLIWSFYEVGLHGWKLLPRLYMPTIITLYLMMPWVWTKLGKRGPQAKRSIKNAEKSSLVLASIPGIAALIVALTGIGAATYAYWQVDMPAAPVAAVDNSFFDAKGMASTGIYDGD